MKLYTYQEELLNSNADKIVINWCRGAGKEYAIARYILDREINKVACLGYISYSSLINSFEELSKQYDLKLNTSLQSRTTEINLKGSKRVIEVEAFSLAHTEFEDYDLVIGDMYSSIKSKSHIIPITKNIHTDNFPNEYLVHTVDYKLALSQGAINLDDLLNIALDEKETFYREFALNDKFIKAEKNFEEFTKEALKRLQKQFLNTSDSKDTVLTRKNIIEMIKDLKEMSGLK